MVTSLASKPLCPLTTDGFAVHIGRADRARRRVRLLSFLIRPVNDVPQRSAAATSFLQLAAATLEDVLLITDAVGRIAEANRAAGALLGSPPDALVGQSLPTRARMLSSGELATWLDGAIRAGDSSPHDFALAGTLHTGVWEARVRLLDTSGGGSFRLVQLRDVTAQAVRVQEAVARAARLRLLASRMNEMAFLMRIEGPAGFRCEAVNETYLAATGLREEEILEKAPHDVFPDPDATSMVARCEQALAAQDPILYREEITSGVGRLVLETRLEVVRDAGGRPTHLLGHARNVTGEAEASEALRDSADRLRGVIEAGLDAFVIARAQRTDDGTIDRFTIVECNERAARMVQQSREALLGNSLLDMFPSSREWSLWEQCCAVLITGEPIETTQLAPLPDQPLRWLQRQLVPVGGDSVAIASRDITPRQLERMALEESEVRQRQLFENNGAIQLLADIDTAQIIDVNPAAVTFYGWPRDTMRAMYVTDLEAVGLDQWRETTSAIATGTGLRAPRAHRVANGELRQVESFIGVVAIAQRRVLHIIIQDTTDRVRAERQLRESDARFRAVIAGMQEGVVLHDETGAIRAYNPSAERILGLTGAQLLGLKPIDRDWHAMHEDGSPWPAETHPALIALQTGRSQSRTLMGVQRGDGTFAWLTVTADPLLHAGEQRPYASVAVFTDVTDSRMSEERLRQAQKLEVVGQLAGGIAHDFNNLLTVLRGSTGFLRDGMGLASPLLDDVAAMERATDRAEELTRRLLAVGRRQMLRAEPVELHQLLRDQLPVIRDEVPLRIALHLELSDGASYASVDRTGLLDALRAVVDNAIAAMPESGTLSLSAGAVIARHPQAHEADPPQHFAMLAIRDTGVGMRDETKARLFEPFFSTQEFGGNKGMSLASVHGLVHQSRGFIECDSAPGKGTELRLYFPVPMLTPSAAVPVARATPAPVAGSVLLVDDDPMLIDLGRRMLEKLGHAVATVESAERALHFLGLHASEISLVITDITMPGMSGLALMAEVSTRYPDLPMVVVSGYSINPDARAEIDRRGVPFVSKPFSSPQLNDAIQRALVRSR